MLPFTTMGSGSPSLVLMPFLGGTQAEWLEVVDSLGPNYRCLTVDLPGFGAAAAIKGYSVEEMADHLIATLRHLNHSHGGPRPYVLIGHSMAGKLSAVVTRRLLDDPSIYHAPAALVLVSPSPPSPEPMTEKKRAEMLAMFGADPRESDLNMADRYIGENTATSLPEAKQSRTAAGVLEMDRAAWNAWLQYGSKEDWSEYVGVLSLPVLLVTGKSDEALGSAAQRESTLPHFPDAQIVELACSHLAPLELPQELSAEIQRFLACVLRPTPIEGAS